MRLVLRLRLVTYLWLWFMGVFCCIGVRNYWYVCFPFIAQQLYIAYAQLLVKLKLWGEGRAIGCKDLSCFWGSEKRDVLFVRVAGFLVLVSPFRFCRCSRQLSWWVMVPELSHMWLALFMHGRCKRLIKIIDDFLLEIWWGVVVPI
jgi:hypothetical protein